MALQPKLGSSLKGRAFKLDPMALQPKLGSSLHILQGIMQQIHSNPAWHSEPLHIWQPI